MKPSINHIFNTVLFVGLLTLMSLGNLLSGDVEGIIPGENRLPQHQPTLSLTKVIRGDYTRLYDQYIADHFMLRNTFLWISAKMESFKRLPGSDSVQLVTFDGANVSQSVAPNMSSAHDAFTENTASIEPLTTTPENALTTAENFGQLLVLQDSVMELHRHNEAVIHAYADVLNAFAKALPETQVFSMMVPTRVQFIDNPSYRSLSNDQLASVQLLDDLFSSDITSIRVFDILAQAPLDDAYFRTDHHWTARGAYLAYSAFMSQTQRQPVPLDTYERVEFDHFLGSLYHATRQEELAGSPDVLEIFVPPGNPSYAVYSAGIHEAPYQSNVIDLNQYDLGMPFGVFLGGDQPLSIIQGSGSSHRSILVVKDSFGNPLIPFLLPHYDTIHVIDPRLARENLVDYVITQQVDEVLFLNYVLVTRYIGYVNLLESLTE